MALGRRSLLEYSGVNKSEGYTEVYVCVQKNEFAAMPPHSIIHLYIAPVFAPFSVCVCVFTLAYAVYIFMQNFIDIYMSTVHIELYSYCTTTPFEMPDEP